MAWALVQRRQASSSANGSTASVTLLAGATAGNLIVAWCNSDAAPTNPTGFTSNATWVNFSEIQVSSKVAAGGETTISFPLSASDSWNCEVFEFSGNGTATADKTVTTNTASGTSIPTGTTATLTGASDLAIAFYGNDGSEAASAITGGFGSLVSLTATGTSSPITSAASAYQFLAATTGVGGTWTIAGGAGNLVAGVVTWQAGASGTAFTRTVDDLAFPSASGEGLAVAWAATVPDQAGATDAFAAVVPSAWTFTHNVTIG